MHHPAFNADSLLSRKPDAAAVLDHGAVPTSTRRGAEHPERRTTQRPDTSRSPTHGYCTIRD
jgi:hypothetical protein